MPVLTTHGGTDVKKRLSLAAGALVAAMLPGVAAAQTTPADDTNQFTVPVADYAWDGRLASDVTRDYVWDRRLTSDATRDYVWDGRLASDVTRDYVWDRRLTSGATRDYVWDGRLADSLTLDVALTK